MSFGKCRGIIEKWGYGIPLPPPYPFCIKEQHMTILSATVAHVNFPLPCETIEGLMDENKSFYVAVPQICVLFSILTKNASRDFKALLGKDHSILKLQTPLHSNPVNAIPLEDFGALVLELALKGNKDITTLKPISLYTRMG